MREGLYRPSTTDQEADQEENDEDDEADFSDSGRGCCYTAKAENSGNNRNDQKYPGVPEHAVSILRHMRKQVRCQAAGSAVPYRTKQ